MLKTVVERAGFKELFASSKATGASAKALAAVPSALSHFALDQS